MGPALLLKWFWKLNSISVAYWKPMVASKLRLLRARWITDGSRCHPSPIWKAMFHLFPVFHSAINIEPSSAVPIKRKLHGCSINSSIVSCNFQVNNTITSGILDPTVTQWLHMVCGLWTPGTRCPNVDTMSAFDVSGALRVGKNVVCSMCYCPGGSCIKCRIVNCSIHFHPWCAHQKGLLQSEVEGFDNEKVIFYGRCLLHATNSSLHTGNQSLDVNAAVENPAEQEPTCARTEGYKGCKMGEALRRNLDSEPNDKSGCLVTQEQINA